MNLFPLFYLRYYLRKHFSDYRYNLQDKIDFATVFENYNFTQREKEIFLLMLEGKSNQDIKNKLFLSIKTVKNHVYNIYKKMGINNRTQLLAFLQDLYNGG
jgi:DNA-binding CsgD family transcriptional regulator